LNLPVKRGREIHNQKEERKEKQTKEIRKRATNLYTYRAPLPLAASAPEQGSESLPGKEVFNKTAGRGLRGAAQGRGCQPVNRQSAEYSR